MSVAPEVEMLLVEDDRNDIELMLRAFRARNLANQVFVTRDCAEALVFFFGKEAHPCATSASCRA